MSGKGSDKHIYLYPDLSRASNSSFLVSQWSQRHTRSIKGPGFTAGWGQYLQTRILWRLGNSNLGSQDAGTPPKQVEPCPRAGSGLGAKFSFKKAEEV